MTRKLSLQQRLAWAMSALTSAAIIIFAIALSMAAEEREEDLINEVVNTALDGIIAQPATANLSLPKHLQLFHAPLGQTPAQLPPELLKFPLGNAEWYQGDLEFHVGVREANGERWYVLYNTEEHERRLSTLHLWLLMSALGVIGLAWICGHFLANSLLAQLARLTQSVQNDTPVDVSEAMDEEIAILAQRIAQSRDAQIQLLARERQFTAHLSHEIRTPLTRIRTSAELLLDTSPPPLHRRIDKIVSSVDEVEGKLRGLLLLARGVALGQTSTLSLAAALNAAEQRLPDTKRELQWKNQVDTDIQVEADPELLGLLLDNLLSNAWRYTEQGSVSASYAEGELTVSDTGCGIDPTALPHVFEPFRRASDVAEGHGLGLAIVAAICNRMGWHYHIHSEVGKGSSVVIGFQKKP
ncbi:HAMP domain-containing histidine kinase [Deefgea tanakiae]|uniref:histidine kinase n=1 Tax=Deefgea tanakiae TaxID=2865840 RepID=A0ABX8Z834_9NEIS|nr:HAMP domain-containing sensor histidine kinase [Deefgea tanakiae]QZA77243.1 HAMP domain-containing histidine kinase [Deefgea tanakiae]